jgi:hypothetical protein
MRYVFNSVDNPLAAILVRLAKIHVILTPNPSILLNAI